MQNLSWVFARRSYISSYFEKASRCLGNDTIVITTNNGKCWCKCLGTLAHALSIRSDKQNPRNTWTINISSTSQQSPVSEVSPPNPPPRPRPCLLSASTAAFASRSRWTMESWPFSAAKCSGVLPQEPRPSRRQNPTERRGWKKFGASKSQSFGNFADLPQTFRQCSHFSKGTLRACLANLWTSIMQNLSWVFARRSYISSYFEKASRCLGNDTIVITTNNRKCWCKCLGTLAHALSIRSDKQNPRNTWTINISSTSQQSPVSEVSPPNPPPRPRPYLFCASTAAFASRSRWTMESWPFSAAKCSGVLPQEPRPEARQNPTERRGEKLWDNFGAPKVEVWKLPLKLPLDLKKIVVLRCLEVIELAEKGRVNHGGSPNDLVPSSTYQFEWAS